MNGIHAARCRASFSTRLIAIVALLVSLALFGALAPAQAQDFRFTEVVIEGNQRIEGATILSFAGIVRGQQQDQGRGPFGLHPEPVAAGVQPDTRRA
jgi:outer membrane protein insertion porin family